MVSYLAESGDVDDVAKIGRIDRVCNSGCRCLGVFSGAWWMDFVVRLRCGRGRWLPGESCGLVGLLQNKRLLFRVAGNVVNV
jgi:hypothetical protein